MKLFLMLGSINAFLAVALGAFGAHGLKAILPAEKLAVYNTGVQYQMYHALALILVAIVADKFGGSSMITWSGWSMFIGIILFSGSLYALSITGLKVFGPITPIGGVAFLLGWVFLLIGVMRG